MRSARLSCLPCAFLAAASLFAQQGKSKPAANVPNKGDTKPVVAPEAAPAKDENAIDPNVVVSYHPALIRDPFGSPSDAKNEMRQEAIDEVGIKGSFVLRGKAFAVIIDSRGKSKTIQVGHRFKDGEVVAIDEKSVTFNQWDPNSTIRSNARRVVKLFKREEGKR